MSPGSTSTTSGQSSYHRHGLCPGMPLGAPSCCAWTPARLRCAGVQCWLTSQTHTLPTPPPRALDAAAQGHLKRTCEAPVHASLEKKPSWNGTTRGGGDSKTRDAMTAELTRRSCAASRRRARRIATPANGYMTPTQRETARMVALRARRTATAKALQRGGPTPPEDWLAHFDSATLAWSARPSWAEASGGGRHTSSSPHQPQADPTFTGAPGTAAHAGFGDRGTAAADAQVAQLMGALPGTRPAGTGNKRGGLKSAGTATWQAGYWAHAMPPEPDVATVESVWGKGVLQGQAGVKRDFVPPAYTLPH